MSPEARFILWLNFRFAHTWAFLIGVFLLVCVVMPLGIVLVMKDSYTIFGRSDPLFWLVFSLVFSAVSAVVMLAYALPDFRRWRRVSLEAEES